MGFPVRKFSVKYFSHLQLIILLLHSTHGDVLLNVTTFEEDPTIVSQVIEPNQTVITVKEMSNATAASARINIDTNDDDCCNGNDDLQSNDTALHPRAAEAISRGKSPGKEGGYKSKKNNGALSMTVNREEKSLWIRRLFTLCQIFIIFLFL